MARLKIIGPHCINVQKLVISVPVTKELKFLSKKRNMN
jgi:hypothetical protein